VKGHVYRSLLDHIRTLIPSGLDAVLPSLPTEDVRTFFQQSFLHSAWYDVLPMLPLNTAVGRVAGLTMTQVVREASRAQALRDVNGVYRFVLKLASPELVVERLPRATKNYFDFGSTEIDGRMPGQATLLRTGVPACLLPWYCAVTEGFVAVPLELAGAKDVRVRPARAESDGTKLGVETLKVPFQLQWR